MGSSKLFKRLGIALTGMALAIGVGVGLSQRGEYKEVRATAQTVQKTSFAAVSGAMDDCIRFDSYQGGGTTAPGVYSNAIRLYQNNSGTPGGIIVVSVIENTGATITKIAITSSNDTTMGWQTGSHSTDTTKANYTSVSLTSNTAWDTGTISVTSYTFCCLGNSSGTRLNIKTLKVWYDDGKAATKSISVDSPVKIDYGSNIKTATLEATRNNGAAGTITWAIKSGNCVSLPDVKTGDSIVVTATGVGQAVVTASCEDCDDPVDVTINCVNTTHSGTLADPYSVADALLVAARAGNTDPEVNYFIRGYIIGKRYYSDTHTGTFDLGDTADATEKLNCFKTYGDANKTGFDDVLAASVVVNGNPITVCGSPFMYNGTKAEISEGYVYSKSPSSLASTTASGSYNAGDEPTISDLGITITVTYDDGTYDDVTASAEITDGLPLVKGSNTLEITYTEAHAHTNVDKAVTCNVVVSNVAQPVTSISIDIAENAMSISSTDETAHTVNVSINSSANDQKVNIAHQAGTENLFTKSAAQITCVEGSGSFTLTGTGATSGTETFRISSNSTPTKYVDLVVTALDGSIVYYTVTMEVDHYSLAGEKLYVAGSDVDDLALSADAKYNLPTSITATGAGTYNDDWSYNSANGEICIIGISSNVVISFSTNPAVIGFITVSGQKTSFAFGEPFSFGGTVTGTYDDSALTEEVLVSGYTVDSSNFDNSVPGTYTIVVSYPNCSDFEYDVTVANSEKTIVMNGASVDRLKGTGNTSYADFNGNHTINGYKIKTNQFMVPNNGDYNGKLQGKKNEAVTYNTTETPIYRGIKMIKVTGIDADDFTLKFSNNYSGADFASMEYGAQKITVGGSTYYLPYDEGNTTVASGTYSYFYMKLGNTATAYLTSIEILTPDTATEEFAKVYLAAYTCNNNGTALPTQTDGYWAENNTVVNLYNALPTDIQNTLKNAADNHTSSYGADKVKEFGERYYWIVYNHYSADHAYDFMDRVSASAITPKSTMMPGTTLIENKEKNNLFLTIVIISSFGVLAIGGYFFIRRRKER